MVFASLLVAAVICAQGQMGSMQPARGGAGEGGTVIPGAVKSVPGGSAPESTINFVQTNVRLIDGAGHGLDRVLVCVRDAMGEIVAVRFTDSQGYAIFVTEGPQGVMLDAVSVGVAGVPFVPGTNQLIIADI